MDYCRFKNCIRKRYYNCIYCIKHHSKHNINENICMIKKYVCKDTFDIINDYVDNIKLSKYKFCSEYCALINIHKHI